MKKTVSLILAIVMCLSLCACGGNANDKYAGTYVGRWYFNFDHIPYSQMDNRYMDSYDVDLHGQFTYILNNDGTGTMRFVATELLHEENVEMFICPITWEVVDGYIYVSGSCGSPYTEETIEIDDKFSIEGKDLKHMRERGLTIRKQ